MRNNKRPLHRLGAAAILLICCAAPCLAQVPATILTVTGETDRGTLLDLGPTSRLVTPIPPHIGPASVFDVAVDAIRQITIDFPRVIVETAEGVIIGPWNAFRGIPETLTLDRGLETIALKVFDLRAIALNNTPLHEVPREWLGDGFLTKPVLRYGGPATAASEIVSLPTLPALPTTAETPLFDDLYPTYPVETEAEGIPWWLIVIGVAAVVAITLLGTGGSS